MTSENIRLIENCKVDNVDKISDDAINLFFSNKEVDAYNIKTLLKLNTEGCITIAIDSVAGAGTRSQKQYLLRTTKKMKRTDTANLSTEINLKISAKYMLVYNIRTCDGLVNGAMGILRKIEYCKIKNSEEQGVKRIWIEFENEKVGEMTRKECVSYAVKNKINLRYTPITRMKKQIKTTRNSALSVMRSQFPIQVAESITIHKSQGATYNQCAVHLQPSMSRQMMYVAFSRATKSSGLQIIGNFRPPEQPSEDDPLIKEFKRLRQDPVVPIYKFLHNRGDYGGIQLIYHNIQSLNSHYEDLKADPCFMQSDIILLAETWSLPSDYFDIPGFDLMIRIDSAKRTRKPSGVMIYLNERIKPRFIKCCKTDFHGVQIAIVSLQEKVRFAVLYANPHIDDDDKLDAIFRSLEDEEECKTVLVGDFNTNFDSSEGQEFAQALQIMDMELRTNPKHYTTRGSTSIDAIFSNRSMRADVYMSTYSYHMPLYGRIE